ncbi:MAG: cell wall-binding repeat-containing protein [Thermoleophilaceae bacterium]|nr:cell wall-binding repeat-containing protein [Thermoleophilaceae bacterium]
MRRSILLALLPALLLGGCSLGDDDSDRPPALGAKSSDDEAAVKLGFPSAATSNTVRIGGGDAIADAAGTASVVFPATSDETKPDAVVLVDKDDWQGAVAAGVLAGTPIGAPILLSDDDDLPAITEDTLKRLDPKGSDLSRDSKVIRIGSKPPAPQGLKSVQVSGKDPYEVAAAIDRFSSVARGEPTKDVVVTTGERAEYALPASAYAASSGDSVLYAQRSKVPAATVAALKAHQKPNIYILGPESVIDKTAEKELAKYGKVRRVDGPTPVQNAIEFARFSASGFGWGISVPGHNFTLADTARPLDAAPAAALGTNGVFAPLLLTDDSAKLPRSVESYLLDVQPGFEDDPNLAVYNKVFILGDDGTISVAAQGRLNEITKLIPVQAERP